MGLCVRQLVRPGLVCAVVAHAHRQHAIVTVGDEGAHCVGWGEGQVLGTGGTGRKVVEFQLEFPYDAPLCARLVCAWCAYETVYCAWDA